MRLQAARLLADPLIRSVIYKHPGRSERLPAHRPDRLPAIRGRRPGREHELEQARGARWVDREPIPGRLAVADPQHPDFISSIGQGGTMDAIRHWAGIDAIAPAQLVAAALVEGSLVVSPASSYRSAVARTGRTLELVLVSGDGRCLGFAAPSLPSLRIPSSIDEWSSLACSDAPAAPRSGIMVVAHRGRDGSGERYQGDDSLDRASLSGNRAAPTQSPEARGACQAMSCGAATVGT